MHRINYIVLCIVLSACASGPYPVSSPYYQIPSGSQLVLKQQLIIPANTGSVYIQYGKAVSDRDKDQYYAHCWFTAWTISSKPGAIEPDIFIVNSTRQEEYYVSLQMPVILASIHPFIISGLLFNDTPIEYSTVLSIHSDKQPDIRRFTCSHWEDPSDATHLTVAQINQALGEVAELKLNRQ